MEVGSHFDESVSCLASLAGTRSVVPMISDFVVHNFLRGAHCKTT